MGCGASSNTQISPINTEQQSPTGPTSMGFKKETLPVPNSVNSNKNSKNHDEINLAQNQTSHRTTSNGFALSLLFPCRFVGNHPSPVITENPFLVQTCSVEIQTENDLTGFKCQYSQTDSFNMSDDEFEAMIMELDQEINQPVIDSHKNVDITTRDELDPDDEFYSSNKNWKSIIKSHKNELEHKQFVNVGVQATKKKRMNATQTKFGSIDYSFGKNSTTNHNELRSLKENICKAIVNSNSTDPSLNKLLSSVEDDDDDEDGEEYEVDEMANKMVDSLKQTLSSCCKVVDGSINNQHKEQQLPAQVSTTNKPNLSRNLWHSKSKRLLKQQKVQDCLFLLLEDIRNKKTLDQLLPIARPCDNVAKRDVSLQTTNDILTDEAPEFAARSPLCHKNEIIPSVLMFRDIDQKMLDAPDFRATQDIAQYVCKHARNDLFKIRALFTWITKNIKFNFKAIEKNSNSAEILDQREGVSKDYCRLFEDVCRIMGIRVKKIDGFVRDYDYRPGYHFKPGKDGLSSWNAAFVLSSWRLVDLTLASGYTDATGEFHNKTNEHYFLTDPSVMIWSHFPYSDLEKDYDRWQLLDKPFTLEEFNALPKVTEYFFQYNLSIRSKIQTPLGFRISTEIKIGSHEAMRYKYKLYPSDEVENSSLNYYVFCQLKEDRLVGSFMVQPPLEGRYILKIFSKPEREMHGGEQDLSASLNPIITMLLECTKARKYIEPFPLNELPWGLTQKFYDYKLKLCNQKGPIIVTWGGRRRLVLEANETMLITYSLYDSDSMEMDTRNFISREDNGFKTIFTINPPRVGTFKFILFGMPKPKQKGKWRLPMLATLMIDCKLIKPPQHDEDMMALSHTADDKIDKKSKGKK